LRVTVTPVPGGYRPCPGVKNPALAKFSNEYQGFRDEWACLCRDATQVKRLKPAHFPQVDHQRGAVVPARHVSSINSGWGRPPEVIREMTRFIIGSAQGDGHDQVRDLPNAI
jgi:hypothetical protein